MVFLYFTCKFIHEQFSPPPIPSLEGGHPSFPILTPAPEKTRSSPPPHKTTRDKRKTTFTTLLSLFAGFSEVQRPSIKKRTKQIGLSFSGRGREYYIRCRRLRKRNGSLSFPFSLHSPLPPPLPWESGQLGDTQRKGGRREIDGCHTLDSGPPASERGKGKSVGQWSTPPQPPIPPPPVTRVIREQALCDPGVETCPESLARFFKKCMRFWTK